MPYQSDMNANDPQQVYDGNFHNPQQSQLYPRPYPRPRPYPPQCRWVRECRWERQCYPRNGF
ncbi:hypothetical protein BW897_30750 [Bacillus cereus]|uniref:Uncharacterized protein n=1 Tax=Bacillus cereus TaxID=1396 RepID=A0A1S9T9D9_BACCE|nr:hypothetical protein BW897_30750 [Bacillus cereus]